MSASLVGSEMCIRDSAASARKLRRQHSREAQPPPRPQRCADSPEGRSVSYTHLTLPTICSV
eukprot:14235981-Alexandrium_andersonii.AAC.1